MKYKYQKEIDECVDSGELLPDDLHVPVNKEAYRFAFSPDSNNLNHKPQFINYRDSLKNRKVQITDLSLSCFSDKQAAKIRYNKIHNYCQNFHRKVGKHLFKGILTEKDGEITSCNQDCHFDLLEYKNCDLNKSFKMEEKIYDED